MSSVTGISNRLLALCAAGLLLAGAAPHADDSEYGVRYLVSPEPAQGSVQVEMVVEQESALLREVRLSMPAARFTNVAGDGHLVHDQGRSVWLPPASGGSLSWNVQVAHRRNGNSYDALLHAEWGLFRASDIIPPAATRTRAGARSKTTLSFSLPAGWSVVTQYKREGGRYSIDNPERRYDRPTGWILLGDIGTRTDSIAGHRVTVAAPVNQGVRRMDMLAFMRWTLPVAARIFVALPDRLTIIAAGDPMWRGGLSAPASIFMHADRPLISENATSTLLHEISHVGLGISAEARADWIVEGLAEYYGLQILLRSGAISESRYRRSLQRLTTWGKREESLCAKDSSGAVTAKATAIFARLDEEIRSNSGGSASLDDVTSALAQRGEEISLDDIREAAHDAAGADSEVLKQALALDCPN